MEKVFQEDNPDEKMEKKPLMLLTGGSSMLGHYIQNEFKDFHILCAGRDTGNDIPLDLAEEIILPEKPWEAVIHVASTDNPDKAEEVNHWGTLRLLDALEKCQPKSFVYVSTYKVYGLEEGEMIAESSTSWADDPVGLSRIRAEKAVWKWCEKRGVKCTVLRPAPMFGNGVCGWQADVFKAVNIGYYYLVRGNTSRRSIVLAYDVAGIIRRLLSVGGVYNVADPRMRSWVDLVEAMAFNSGKMKNVFRLPLKWAQLLAKIGDIVTPLGVVMNSRSLEFQLSTLTFDSSAVIRETGYRFFDTVEVIARKEKNYPYEES